MCVVLFYFLCNIKIATLQQRQHQQPLLVAKHASLLTGNLSDMERSDGESNERQRRCESTPNGTGSEYDSAESGAYSEDDYDDSAYGTMARFVPTLVLERLRSEGEAAMSNQPSGAAEAVADAAEGANVPKVGLLLSCLGVHWRRLMLAVWYIFFSTAVWAFMFFVVLFFSCTSPLYTERTWYNMRDLWRKCKDRLVYILIVKRLLYFRS